MMQPFALGHRNNTTTSTTSTHANWGNGHYNTQVLDLPIIDSLNPRPAQLPLAIPEDGRRANV